MALFAGRIAAGCDAEAGFPTCGCRTGDLMAAACVFNTGLLLVFLLKIDVNHMFGSPSLDE
ncbi:hypothetical protein ACFQAT_02855 [Undibacterium arcticum]|uniref:hypothetical protein n=1 Tax=Undibacterium arcticum TaxID=1762892 RepID=UPI00361AE153